MKNRNLRFVFAEKAVVIVGTRPEIIKMAPLVKALERTSFSFTFVHCGQHYDFEMSKLLMEELELPKPAYGFRVHGHSHGSQTAWMMVFVERVLKHAKPSVVLVEGDTNGVLASALAAVKLGVRVGHVEAGLRSFDLRMPEEHNRRLTDHASAFLFAPTETAKGNLKRENVWGRVFVVGNTAIDAVVQHLPVALEKSRVLERVSFDEFVLATVHRAENVDDPWVLKGLVEAFVEAPIPVVYPVHPRTLESFGLWKKLLGSKNVQVLPPLGYFDFLVLVKHSRFIVTDSGGIQEEATAPPIRKRVLVTRVSTERPEAVELGFARVVGVEKESIVRAMVEELDNNGDCVLPMVSPYGNGDAAEKIVEILKREL